MQRAGAEFFTAGVEHNRLVARTRSVSPVLIVGTCVIIRQHLRHGSIDMAHVYSGVEWIRGCKLL